MLQKPIIILALLLVNSMLFPQNNHNNLTPWCIKPYYGKQYDKELDHNYSCIGLEAFFFLSQSINVGAFVNGGTFKYSMTFYEDNNFILYDGECRDLFWKYGINSEFHPIPLLFPTLESSMSILTDTLVYLSLPQIIGLQNTNSFMAWV